MRAWHDQRFNVREQIKTLYGTGDSIRQNLASQVGDIDAMTGVALAIENIGSDPAELWHPVEWNSDSAAPGIIETDAIQLWIYPEQSRSQILFDYFRVAAKIVAAPAE